METLDWSPPVQPVMDRRRFWVILLVATLVLTLTSSTVTAHGDDDEAGGIRNFLGGFDVRVSASFLHTVGAILLVGGLLGLHGNLRSAQRDEKEPETHLLSSRLIWIGVVMNMLGGIMRLFEPAHPSVLSFFADRWVSVMLVKHAFILLMVATGVYASLGSRPTDTRLLSIRLSLAAVVVIGALGSLAGVIGTQ